MPRRGPPPHVRKRMMTETVSLVRTAGSRDESGVWTEAEAATDIICSTAPLKAGDPRARMLTEGGVKLDAGRLFWTLMELDPVTDTSSGDLLVYAGERWRVRETQRWGNFSETLAVRVEGQRDS